MNNLSTYIIEKLHLNKETKTDNPFIETDFYDGADLITYIVEKIENAGCGNVWVWDDTGKWDVRDDFEDFQTTDGSDIDWIESFHNKTDGAIVAIWDLTKDKKDKLENHPFVKYFKETFDEDVLYKKQGYKVSYWGQLKYDDKINVALIQAPTGESLSDIICFTITEY